MTKTYIYSNHFRKAIQKIVDEEINSFIMNQLSKKTHHMCLSCGFIFRFKSRVHHFCSRKCYSKFHRIPGFVRRIVNHRD